MEVTEENKLIMFFDGAEMIQIDIMGKVATAIRYKGSYYPEDNVPNFHEDWNLLMPVVEKIRKNFDVTIQLLDGDCNMFFARQDFSQTDFTSTGGYANIIEGIWEGVVQFIKEYNSLQPKT